MTGKIIKGIAGFYYINDGRNHVYQCKAKGVFRNRKIKPLVGDNVEFSVLDEEEKEGNIDAIFREKMPWCARRQPMWIRRWYSLP